MKAAFALAAAGVAVAQGTYAPTCPAAGETAADGRFSCNPAHTYPEGQVCQEDGGCYYLRTEYPGVVAPPVYSSTTPGYVAPPTYPTAPSVSVDVPVYRTTTTPKVSVDVPVYRTTTDKVSVDVPVYRTTTAQAHPTSSCPAPGSTALDGRYSCNPAHTYPEGQICQEDGGCYYLRTVTPPLTVTPSASYYVDVPEYRTSVLTVPCPSPTTFVHSASTYIVKTATTLTIPVTYSVDVPVYRTSSVPAKVSVDVPVYRTSVPPKVSVDVPVYRNTTATATATPSVDIPVVRTSSVPATTPDSPVTPPATTPAGQPPVYQPTTMVPSMPTPGNATQTKSIVSYTGAATQQTACAFLAVAAIGALFL